jgi:hypothetical protein
MRPSIILRLKSAPRYMINLFFWILFRFDKWHLRNISTVRHYQSLASQIAIDQDPEFVIELGCGLGEISRKLPRHIEKYLIDCDSKLRFPLNFFFAHHNYKFFSLDLKKAKELIDALPTNDKALLLIFINSAHNLTISELTNLLNCISTKFNVSKILIDFTTAGARSFRHDIDSLDSILKLESFIIIEDLSTEFGRDSGIAVLSPKFDNI